MGAVYRATDGVLGRDVALKVLSADMARDGERLRRFRREARAVAALNHPNIIALYSVEHAHGTHFLTMELVEGRTLEALMAGRPLPIDGLVEIARQIADAVASAHEKGIVHRDLKPANVIVDAGGRAKVLDFGLAKTMAAASGPSRTPPADGATVLATRLGAMLGTPAYMSPEQVKGLEVDHRTDIFSLGVMLYEMATGHRPFSGPSAPELASSILRDVPPPVTALRPSLPPELAQVIARCLEKEPSARFDAMTAVAGALRRPSSAAPAARCPSVAVLPFQNLSTDPDNELFAEGLAEDLLTALTHVDGLRVAARTSSFSFKGRARDIADIGAALNVATVLEGSVRRCGRRLRVSVKLVDAASGFQIWSERYDREMADIFDLQDEIARAVADRLRVTLTAAPATRLVRAGRTDVEAYELYLRGRALLLTRGNRVAEGTECLHRAVEQDPRFAAAWAGLADAYSVRGYWGMAPPGETMPQALAAARRAVDLDPGLAEGQCALALALLLWERNYTAAQAAFRRCLELNPRYTQGRAWYAIFDRQIVHGRLEEGVAEARTALAADPLSAYATAILGLALGLAGRAEAALDTARLGVQRDPDSLFTRWTHALAAYWRGAYEEAVAAFTAAGDVSARHVYTVSYAAAAYAKWGRMDAARALHAEGLALSQTSYVPRAALAVSALAIGELDRAIEFAQQACDEREPVLVVLARVFPDWIRLRRHPGLAEVLRRLALPS